MLRVGRPADLTITAPSTALVSLAWPTGRNVLRPADLFSIRCDANLLAASAPERRHPIYPRGLFMNGLIRASLGNPYAVTVMSLTFIVLGR